MNSSQIVYHAFMISVATLRTCYPEKFGIPRQSGLAPAAWGVVEFTPAYRRVEAVRGLEDFSHLWLITQFHLINEAETAGALTVRPPRAGGNERRGVFATRSPFRPNRLGLTVVRLERVEMEGETAPRLWVSGVDLADGTPIFDIKPYVPYADAVGNAQSTFANQPPPTVPVRWEVDADVEEKDRAVIVQSIALQPQPAYQDNPERTYATELAGWHVRWRSTEKEAVILVCQPVSKSSVRAGSSS